MPDGKDQPQQGGGGSMAEVGKYLGGVISRLSEKGAESRKEKEADIDARIAMYQQVVLSPPLPPGATPEEIEADTRKRQLAAKEVDKLYGLKGDASYSGLAGLFGKLHSARHAKQQADNMGAPSAEAVQGMAQQAQGGQGPHQSAPAPQQGDAQQPQEIPPSAGVPNPAASHELTKHAKGLGGMLRSLPSLLPHSPLTLPPLNPEVFAGGVNTRASAASNTPHFGSFDIPGASLAAGGVQTDALGAPIDPKATYRERDVGGHVGYVPSQPKSSSGGASPITPAEMLPPDAAGPNGQPITPEQRSQSKQWKQWHGEWYPVAGNKGVFKVQKNRLLLLDPSDGHVIKDLGPYQASTVSSHQVAMVGDDNQMHVVTLYSTHDPVTGQEYTSEQAPAEEGNTPTPRGTTSDTPPAAAKKPKSLTHPTASSAPTPAGPKVEGRTLAGYGNTARRKDPAYRDATKEVTKAKSEYEGAQVRMETMDKNLAAAMQGDQQAMLSLVANHIGMTLGAQKGARITRAVWDEAIESAPWLSRITARWSDDGYLKGVALTPEQMHQMVQLGHEKVEILQRNVQRVQEDNADVLGTSSPSSSPKALPHPSGGNVIVVTPQDMAQ